MNTAFFLNDNYLQCDKLKENLRYIELKKYL